MEVFKRIVFIAELSGVMQPPLRKKIHLHHFLHGKIHVKFKKKPLAKGGINFEIQARFFYALLFETKLFISVFLFGR